MEETGITNVADPLGGSWYVEALTDRIEAEAEAIFARIRDMGRSQATQAPSAEAQPVGAGSGSITAGILRGIEDGWFMSEIADSAFAYQQAVEKGDKRVVGVNVHTGSLTRDLDIMRVSHEVEVEQKKLLTERRAQRDNALVKERLERMVAAARGGENMIPSMLDAARAEATLGEICGALKEEWGIYREPARF
jgi:methylmalonyl-CoA mutase N-terminal domain/subunit